MRLVNKYNDPHCEHQMPTWTPGLKITVMQDGRHWKYSVPQYGSFIPQKMSDCLLVELTPASTWKQMRVEYSKLLYSSDGLRVMDISNEHRNIASIQTFRALETTPIGMCFIELDEWSILQEVGARIFAAIDHPY